MAAYTTIDNPELYFQCKLHAGNSSTQSITLDGDEDMQPDVVWIKGRDDAWNNMLYDSVRGVQKHLKPDTTAIEATDSNSLTVFGSDGFTVGTNSDLNYSGENYVARCWNTQGGAGSSNTDGSINTTTTSVGTTQGLSISTYTGTGSTATIGHGLGVTPGVIITKSRGGTFQWAVYHHKNTSAPETDYLYLNTTDATVDDVNVWNDTAPTSTVFTVETSNRTNASSGTYVAYVWTEIQGYSKFGGYEGNGNADGTFVYTGFRPAFVMTKSIDSTSAWHMFDNKRLGYNPDNNALEGDDTTVEATADQIDILSNGFKCRIATDPNVAETYVYMAFAEAPFVNSNGVPCNAR